MKLFVLTYRYDSEENILGVFSSLKLAKQAANYHKDFNNRDLLAVYDCGLNGVSFLPASPIWEAEYTDGKLKRVA